MPERKAEKMEYKDSYNRDRILKKCLTEVFRDKRAMSVSIQLCAEGTNFRTEFSSSVSDYENMRAYSRLVGIGDLR